MILNVGCGDDVRPGMVNIDLRPTGQIVASADRLPVASGTVGGVVASDVLEHVPADRTRSVLDEWDRVLRPGGQLVVRVPNLAALARGLLDRPQHADAFIRNIYGGHRWGPDGGWDAHHHGYTPATLERDLTAAGWRVCSNDEHTNMTVTAVKP